MLFLGLSKLRIVDYHRCERFLLLNVTEESVLWI